MWCCRKLEKIKCSEKVSKEQVLERIGEKRTLRNNVLLRKSIGSVVFREEITSFIEAQMTEVKGVGRRRTQLLDDLRNTRYLKQNEEAEDRKRWKRQLINRT